MDYVKLVLIATSMFIHRATPDKTGNARVAASCNQQVDLVGRQNIGLPVSPYENDMRCDYVITSAPNTFIELEFTKMKLQDSPQCSADSITVFDGGNSSSPEIGTYCGDEIPDPLTSSGSKIFIAFQSDGKNVDEGFEITLTPTHEDRHSSRRDFYADEDNFTQAGGGLIYSHRDYSDGSALAPGNYTLEINLKDGYNQTYIDFVDVALSEEPGFGVVPPCNRRRENIEIYDRDGKLLDTICNGDSGTAIVSEGGMKLVMHISSEKREEKGFLAIYALFYMSEDGKCQNEDDYLCNNSRCIAKYLTDDEHDHCGDGSDLPESNSMGLLEYLVWIIVFVVLLGAFIIGCVLFLGCVQKGRDKSDKWCRSKINKWC